MVLSGCLVGCGRSWCSGRLTGHLDILRLMTLGLVRSRRLGSGSARISVIVCLCALARLWGGKSRLGSGAAPGCAEASGERQSVGVQGAHERGVVHQAADRVVGA